MVRVFTTVLAFLAFQGLGAIASDADELHARSLWIRQTLTPDAIPPACTATCQAISSSIVACADAACICTQINANALTVCVSCVLQATPGSSLSTDAETALSQFYQLCNAIGASLTSIAIPRTTSTTARVQSTITQLPSTPTAGTTAATTTAVAAPPPGNNPLRGGATSTGVISFCMTALGVAIAMIMVTFN